MGARPPPMQHPSAEEWEDMGGLGGHGRTGTSFPHLTKAPMPRGTGQE